jgi:hypothetical protein
MLTISNNDRSDGWKTLFRSLARTVQTFKGQRLHGKSNLAACEEIALRRAILTFRMAANPGEDYETVAVRIEREAARYRAFLEKPQPIGKIALNVKPFLSNDTSDGDISSSYEQYKVTDPDEGNAMVFFNFNRSCRRILEFMVYDENDEPLFPLARTYSDWLGSRVYDLGLNRKFHLNLVESDLRGQIMVQAGFMPSPPQIIATQPARKQDMDERATCTTGTSMPPRNGGKSFFGARMERLFAAGVPCFAVMFLLFLIASSSITTNSAKAVRVMPVTEPAAYVAQALREDKLPLKRNVLWPLAVSLDISEPHAAATATTTTDDAKGVAVIGARTLATTGKKGRQQSLRLDKARRLAGITKLNVSVDRGSCNTAGNPCQEMLTNLQQQIAARLSVSPLQNHEQTEPETDATRTSWLVVSYEATNGKHAHLYLVLYDQEGRLWDKRHELDKEDEGTRLDSAITSSMESSEQLVQEIIKAKEEVVLTSSVD